MLRSAIFAAVILAAAPLMAQQPTNKTAASPSDQPQVNRPAEMPANMPIEVWQYMESMKRYEDPKMAVRRKAEQRAAAREARLASQRWYGVSPLRPMASPLPFMGTAAPMWAGNTWDPYRWVAPRQATIVISRDGVRR